MAEQNSDSDLLEICCVATFAITANPVVVGADDVLIRLKPVSFVMSFVCFVCLFIACIKDQGDNGMLSSLRALVDSSSIKITRDMDIVRTSLHHTVLSCFVYSKHFAKTKHTMWIDFSTFCNVCESKAYFMFTTCSSPPSEGFISFTTDIDESNGAYVPFYEIVSFGGDFISGGHQKSSSAPWLKLINIVLTPYRKSIADVVQKIVPGCISWSDVDRTLVCFSSGYNFDLRQYGPMIANDERTEFKMLSAVNIRSFRQIKILKGCKHLVLYDVKRLGLTEVQIDALTFDNPQCTIYAVVIGGSEDVVLKSYGPHILLHV